MAVDFEQAVRSYLKWALTLVDADVVKDYQDIPKAAKPFCTVGVSSMVPLTSVPEVTPLVDATPPITPASRATRTHIQVYDCTVNVMFYGDTALSNATTARNKMLFQDSLDIWHDAGYPLQRTMPMNRVPVIVGTEWEQRWAYDFVVQAAMTEEEQINWIETVEVTFVVNDQGGVEIMNETITLETS